MIRFRGTVIYLDGSKVEFEVGIKAMMAWERYAQRHGLPMGEGAPAATSNLVIAHAAVGGEEGFDTWLARVDDADVEGVQVPPTPEALPAG